MMRNNERATRERSIAIDGNYSDDNIIITLYTESIIIFPIIMPPSTRKGSRGSKTEPRSLAILEKATRLRLVN